MFDRNLTGIENAIWMAVGAVILAIGILAEMFLPRWVRRWKIMRGRQCPVCKKRMQYDGQMNWDICVCGFRQTRSYHDTRRSSQTDG